MKTSIIILFSIFLLSSSCTRREVDFIGCAKNNGIFTFNTFIPISLDSIDNMSVFYKRTKKYLDTLQNCSLDFAIVFNYSDSIFRPNSDSIKNILIPAFHITSERCQEDRADAIFKIFMNRPDSFMVINKLSGTTFTFWRDFNQLSELIENFYFEIYLKNSDVRSYSYVSVIVSDSNHFNGDFLKVFRMLFNSYKQNINKYFIKHKIDLCNNDFKPHSLQDYQFRVLIDDFDYRNMKLIFIPPK